MKRKEKKKKKFSVVVFFELQNSEVVCEMKDCPCWLGFCSLISWVKRGKYAHCDLGVCVGGLI